jgi:tetratricopeptide (TPR) repeat protein
MRKINGKLFLILLVGAVVLTGAVIGIHLIQYQRIAQALLWQARHAEEQHQVERTAQFLSRYLEFSPRDDVEKAHLASLWAGDAFAQSPRARYRAVRLLDEVLVRDTQRPELRRLLVKTALDLGGADMLKMARNHLEKLLAWEQLRAQLDFAGPVAVDRERGELEGLWGQLFEGESNATDAIRCCRLALKHNPEMDATYVRIAYLLRKSRVEDEARRKAYDHEADEWIHLLVTRNETKAQAYLARWRYRREFDLLEVRPNAKPDGGLVGLSEAREDVRKALERAPEALAPEVYLAAADLERLLGQSHFEDETLSRQEREKRLLEHRDTAYGHLQQGLKLLAALPPRAAPESVHFQLLWHKAGLLLDDLKRADNRSREDAAAPPPEGLRAWEEDVVATIEQARKMRYSPAGVDFLEGRLLVHQRRWAEAAQLFEHARAVLGTQNDLAVQVNLFLGLCYEQLDEPGQMFHAYKAVAERSPKSVQAWLGMAAADWSLRRLDSAAQNYQQLIQLNMVPDKAWLDIARLEIQRQAQQQPPDWALAERALQQAATLLPEAVEVPLLTAEMWVARDYLDRAKSELQEAIRKRGNQPELFAAQAEIALRNDDPTGAFDLLDQATKRVPDCVVLRLSRARYFADTCRNKLDDKELPDKVRETVRAEAAKNIDALAENKEHFSEEDRARLLSGLANAQLRAGNHGPARRLWQQMTELPRYRTDVRLRLLLFDLALQMNDEPGMEQALEDIRGVDQRDGPFARYGEALKLLWRAENGKVDATSAIKEVRLRLDQVQAQRPNWPAVYLVRAHVHEKEGNPEQAIKDIKVAIDNGDTSPDVVGRLADLLMQRGRHDEADAELRRLQQPLVAADPDLNQLAARIALWKQDYKQAVERIRPLVNKPSPEFKHLIFLAKVLVETKPKEAEQHLDRALQIAPKEPAVWVARVQFFARMKRFEDALAAVEQAGKQLEPKDRELILGQCYEGLGRLEDAQKHYKKALDDRPEDVIVIRAVANFYLASGRMRDAEELLRPMADGQVRAASQGDIDWAKHGLALVLATSTDYKQVRKALSLEGIELDSDGNLREPGRDESTEQQKSQARVLATQVGQRQFRRRAIEMLERLEQQGSLMPGDRFVLAILREADGDWRRSQVLLQGLVQKYPTNAQYIARFTLSLLQHEPGDEQLKAASDLIGRLETLESDRNLEPNAYASVEMRARLLEARREGDKALAELRKLLHRNSTKAQPEEALLLLDSFRRQKKFPEAYDLCEQMWTGGPEVPTGKPCRPEVAGGASVAILRTISPTDVQVQRLERQLREAIVKSPKTMVLRLHLADLYDLRGRYADAERLYREVLDPKNEPSNVVALNNLAWLLAHRDGGAVEAFAHINAALHGVGRRADLLDTRGLVYLKLGKHDEALADLREAIDDSPTPTRQFHLAKAYHLTRNETAAVTELKKAQDALNRSGKELPSMIHPSEQEECRSLLQELKVR